MTEKIWATFIVIIIGTTIIAILSREIGSRSTIDSARNFKLCQTVVEIKLCSRLQFCRVLYDDGTFGVKQLPKVGDKTGDCEP